MWSLNRQTCSVWLPQSALIMKVCLFKGTWPFLTEINNDCVIPPLSLMARNINNYFLRATCYFCIYMSWPVQFTSGVIFMKPSQLCDHANLLSGSQWTTVEQSICVVAKLRGLCGEYEYTDIQVQGRYLVEGLYSCRTIWTLSCIETLGFPK
jgi:hypothetical protein